MKNMWRIDLAQPTKKTKTSDARKQQQSFPEPTKPQLLKLTAFMREDSLTDGAGPHAQLAGELGLGVAGQVLPQRTLVDVVLPADRARVVGCPPLRYIRISCRFSLRRVRWRGGRAYTTITRMEEG